MKVNEIFRSIQGEGNGKLLRFCTECGDTMAYKMKRGKRYWMCTNPQCKNVGKEEVGK